MKKKCLHEECECDVYEDNTCILHSKKDNHFNAYDNFNKELAYLISLQLKEQNVPMFSFDDTLESLLENDEENEPKLEGSIKLTHIIFPSINSNEDFTYRKILNKVSDIYFEYCEFHIVYLPLNEIKCYFEECIFHKGWILYDYKPLNKAIYSFCIFKGNISSRIHKNIRYSTEDFVYNASQFDNTCKFQKNCKISLSNAKFKEELFITIDNDFRDKITIPSFIVYNCIFDKKFELNEYIIQTFICNNNVFQNKFEFKNNEIDKFKINRTNFKELVYFDKTKFNSYEVKESIFEKFTSFEQCKFGKENTNYRKATFQQITFLDFVNFREANFFNGLDLEKVTLKEYPNFLAIIINSKNTNRETFRIIKYSFDKVGNTIEANKYFAYEMKKERENTSIKDDLNKKIMLNLNYWISDFGQSWIRPLSIILFVAVLHTLLIYGIDNKIFQIINPSSPMYDFLKWIVDFSNDLAKNILPFKKPLIEGKEFISLVFLIIYSTLIYNFIVAVKRVTKR